MAVDFYFEDLVGDDGRMAMGAEVQVETVDGSSLHHSAAIEAIDEAREWLGPHLYEISQIRGWREPRL
jgi:hypothetical protein